MNVTDRKPVRWEQGADGIVVVTLDDPEHSVNTMNDGYRAAMGECVDALVADRVGITGVIITSAKKTFFAGGDLAWLSAAGPDDAPAIMATSMELKTQFRKLETLGRPVVAAMNGTALGGGLEIGLACHHRIGLDAQGRGLRAARGDAGPAARSRRRRADHPDARHPGRVHEGAGPGAAAQAGRRAGDRHRRRAGHHARADAGPGPGLDQGQPERRAALGPARLPDPGRHPDAPRSWPRCCRRSRPTCASSSRAPRCRRRATSWPRPWRVPRSTSTPRSGSRPATSPSWSAGRSRRT